MNFAGAAGSWLHTAHQMITRMVALLVGAVMLMAALPARADHPLLHPSARALAAADDDEPPPHQQQVVTKPVTPAVPPEETPVYKTWWFWALTAAVVGGTVIFGVATFKPTPHAPQACVPMAAACFGDGRPP